MTRLYQACARAFRQLVRGMSSPSIFWESVCHRRYYFFSEAPQVPGNICLRRKDALLACENHAMTLLVCRTQPIRRILSAGTRGRQP